jgi:K(+)-stimulated pyrophosphate-energized sodium pump
LTCLIGLVIAPILGNGSHTISEKNHSCCIADGSCTSKSEAECVEKGCVNPNCKFLSGLPIAVPIAPPTPPVVEAPTVTTTNEKVKIEITTTDGKCIGKVTTSKGVQVFEGTEAEVQAKIDAIK